jgi:hypothetical protein
MKNQIECKKCGNLIDIDSALTEKIKQELEKDTAIEKRNLLAEIDKERQFFIKEKEQLAKDKKEMGAQIEKEVKAQELVLRNSIKAELNKEIGSELEHFKKKINEQNELLSKARVKELELLDLQNSIEVERESIDLTVKKKIMIEKALIVQQAKLEQKEEMSMSLKDKDHLIESLKKQTDDLKKKIDQGSIQSQGEVQENALQLVLESSFPFDIISEVGKGVNGADILQQVFTEFRQSCGIIAYESKRTKAFSNQWIDKMKTDMVNHKADIAVIVTEALPKEMERFGLINGIWVCTYQDAYTGEIDPLFPFEIDPPFGDAK